MYKCIFLLNDVIFSATKLENCFAHSGLMKSNQIKTSENKRINKCTNIDKKDRLELGLI